jgi:hypothetical protein
LKICRQARRELFFSAFLCVLWAHKWTGKKRPAFPEKKYFCFGKRFKTSMNTLSKENILKYLEELSREIGKEGLKGEILIQLSRNT